MMVRMQALSVSLAHKESMQTQHQDEVSTWKSGFIGFCLKKKDLKEIGIIRIIIYDYEKV